MNKKFSYLLFLFVAVFTFNSGICYGNVKAATTIFPLYDWLREISKGTDAEVSLIIDKSIDFHSYQPTVDDIIEISECDFFVYVGGESEKWVKNVLKNVGNKKQTTVNLIEVLGNSAKTEETVEGMQHEHEDEDEHDHDHEHEAELDEHVWLSLRNAEKLCKYLAEKLSEIDEKNKEIYISNASQYIEKLSELDKKFTEAANKGKRKFLLFADRFPFRYFVDDYKLKYYAAFSGCSAETEASFETVIFLAKKTDELKLPCVIAIEGRVHKIPETVISNTEEKNQKILILDSMQSVTPKEIEKGATYLSMMKENLEVIEEALN